nr:copia protein [Tanacetum cinerariifolium]GEW93506.1 copia protein [Tanacetum cinerariifolium]
MIRNKSRLVSQGHTQKEGIDYDEVFTLVARIEGIRLFLAYASFKDFMVYQMDLKRVFLSEMIEEEITAKVKSTNGEARIHAKVDGKKTQKQIKPRRKVIEVSQPSDPMEHVVDEVVYKELDNRLVRVAITASSLEAECQEAMRDTIAQTRVPDLEKTKTTQVLEIDSLKRRVKQLEKIIQDITLVNDQDDEQMFDVNYLQGEEMFVREDVADKEVTHKVQKVVEDINIAKLIVDAAGEVNAASIVTTVSATATMTVDEVTLAQSLMEIKSTKPKAKGIVLQETSESRTTTIKISSKKSQDKGKAILIEEPVKLNKKDQIMLDEEVALKLQAELQVEFDKEQRLASEKAQQEEEANIALTET